jgi:hypothetical protein
MTLLELVQAVCDELAITRPLTVIGANDKNVRQLLALLNRLGSDITRQFEWNRLNLEHILTTVAIDVTGNMTDGSATITGISDTTGITTNFGLYGPGIVPFAQVVSTTPTTVTLNMPVTETIVGAALQFSQNQYDLPADWQRQIPQTEWDRTNRWPLMGPQSAQDWQSFKSGIVYAGPRERFRIQQGQIYVNPPPPNGLIFAFEYISNGWVESSTGVRKSSYTENTDTSIYPDSLLITGLKTQWKAAKGIDASFDLSEFKSILELNKAQDKSAPKLSLSPFGGTVLLSDYNLPDGNWPGN